MDLQPIHPNTPIRQRNRPCPQRRRGTTPRTNSRGTPVIPAKAIILVLKDQAGRDGRGGSRALLSPRKALSSHDKRSYPSTQDHGDPTQFFIVKSHQAGYGRSCRVVVYVGATLMSPLLFAALNFLFLYPSTLTNRHCSQVLGQIPFRVFSLVRTSP